MTISLLGVLASWVQAEPAAPAESAAEVPAGPTKPFPLRWTTTDNVRWQVELPGPGNAAACISGNRVFVTCEVEQGRRRGLLCYDRQRGNLLWDAYVDCPSQAGPAGDTPYGWAAPAADEQVVVVWHGTAGIHAYSLAGQHLWSQVADPFGLASDAGSSPILDGNTVLLNVGPAVECAALALDRDTGRQRWRHAFPGLSSDQTGGLQGRWSTPVLTRRGDRSELLISLPGRLLALDPQSGDELWSCTGLGTQVHLSPLVSTDLIVALSSFWGPALGVRPGGRGDITNSRVAWRHPEPATQRVECGVVVAPCIYTLNAQGTAWCVALDSGEILWKHQLSPKGAWSAITAAGGKLYAIDLAGTTYVLEPNPSECKILAENLLNELTRAPLALADGQVFARTYGHLFCLEVASPPD